MKVSQKFLKVTKLKFQFQKIFKQTQKECFNHLTQLISNKLRANFNKSYQEALKPKMQIYTMTNYKFRKRFNKSIKMEESIKLKNSQTFHLQKRQMMNLI